MHQSNRVLPSFSALTTRIAGDVITAGMAERAPNFLASYEAAQTTERFPRQATTTGLPRSCGSSRCSTDAQKASMSICAILRCQHGRTILGPPTVCWFNGKNCDSLERRT
jgi:hypothetical protein